MALKLPQILLAVVTATVVFSTGHANELPSDHGSQPTTLGIPEQLPNGVRLRLPTKSPSPSAAPNAPVAEKPAVQPLPAGSPLAGSQVPDPAALLPASTVGLPKPVEPAVVPEVAFPTNLAVQSLVFGAVQLLVPEGAADQLAQIAVEPLTEVSPLKVGMNNVTGLAVNSNQPLGSIVSTSAQQAAVGYRFTPAGLQFKTTIKVSLPYNPEKLPAGVTAQDIYSYYYDNQAQQWQRLRRVSVDEENQLIVSITSHFTDMINATVTVPDHAQPENFDPNSLKNIKAANPAAGINLIQPPGPSQMGDANLSYPIELPAGRNGAQPGLAVNYSSGGGNGWMGLGWNLSSSSISIDMRWGVPRYGFTPQDNTLRETDTYLLDGQMLVPMNADGTEAALPHRLSLNQQEPRQANREFRLRVEGSFLTLIRHGDAPSNHWWEVIDKAGNRSFYGGTPEQGVSANSVLADPDSGNINRWALRESRDTNGNTVLYDCEVVQDTGMVGGAVQGRQLYLKSIHYSGNRNTNITPAYRVDFIRDRNLPNYQANQHCNTGNNTRRCDVSISGMEGFKTVTADLLKRVNIHYVADGSDVLVRQYRFDYTTGSFHKTLLQAIHQYGADGGLFNTHTLGYFKDEPGAEVGFGEQVEWQGAGEHLDNVLNQPLASLISGNAGDSYGGHLFVGWSDSSGKTDSYGAKLGFSVRKNSSELALIDINGDGLADKVYGEGGYEYQPNLGHSEAGSFGPAKAVGLGEINRDKSLTFSFGLEAHHEDFSIIGNQARTANTTEAYMVDVNGDGLIDLVDNGSVVFNKAEPSNANIAYDSNSFTTSFPVNLGVVEHEGLFDFSDQEQQYREQFPLADSIRRWKAPVAGTIVVNSKLVVAESTENKQDGVRAAIQHNSSELWSQLLLPGQSNSSSHVVSVDVGDRIYFRIGSVDDGSNDQVEWSPSISYVGAPKVDANGLDQHQYASDQDFVLAGREVTVNAPLDGTIQLEGVFQKTLVTTDEIVISLLHNDAAVYQKTIPSSALGDQSVTHSLAVNQGDALQLVVHADSAINLKAFDWRPHLRYQDVPPQPGVVIGADGNGPDVELNASYTMVAYSARPGVVQQAWQAPTTTTAYFTPNFSMANSASGEVVVTLKSNGNLLAKKALTINGGQVANSQNGRFSVGIVAGQQIFIDVSVADPKLASDIQQVALQVQYGSQSSLVSQPYVAVQEAIPDFTGQQPYRYWSYFGYRGNGSSAAQPINESLLVPLPEDIETYDVSAADWHLLWPYFSDQNAYPQWRGVKSNLWVQPDRMSASRIGADSIEVPSANKFLGATAVDRVTESIHYTIAGSTQSSNSGGANASGGGDVSFGESESITDFFDMNGDRFPDVISQGGIQYSNPNGGLSGHRAGFESFRETQTTGLSGNAGVSGLPDTESAESGGADTATGGDSGGADSTTPDGEGAGADSGGDSPGAGDSGEVEANPYLTELPDMNTQFQAVLAGKVVHQKPNLGASGSYGQSLSFSNAELIDINGDGLADLVKGLEVNPPAALGSDAGKMTTVRLNLGYKFAAAEAFPVPQQGQSEQPALNESRNQSGSLGVQPSGGSYSSKVAYEWGGGVNAALNQGDVSAQLIDINGDGLPDQVIGQSVRLNTGAGFGASHVWRNGDGNVSTNRGYDFGGGGYFTASIKIKYGYIILNPGFNAGLAASKHIQIIRDINGDGYPDFLQSDDDDELRVRLNLRGKTNLLKQVQRPLGGRIDLDYKRSGNTFNQPHNRWVLASTDVHDGLVGDGVDTSRSEFDYADGFHSRWERDFYGFGTVTVSSLDAANNNALYRQAITEYHNRDYYLKGQAIRSQMKDAAGQLFSETVNHYQLISVANQQPLAPHSVASAGDQATERQHRIFPQAVGSDQYFYEGQALPGQATRTTTAYDAIGNAVSFCDLGEVGLLLDNSADQRLDDNVRQGDDLCARIAYHQDPAAHIIGLPKRIRVFGGPGARNVVASAAALADPAPDNPGQGLQLLRERRAEFQAGTGNLLAAHACRLDLQTSCDPTVAEDAESTLITYTPEGLLDTLTGPTGVQLTYGWEPKTRTHPLSIEQQYQCAGSVCTQARSLRTALTGIDIDPSFTEQASFTYTPTTLKLGLATSTVDMNGQVMSNVYDQFARTTAVYGPDEQGEALATISFEYHPQATVPHAITRHLDIACDDVAQVAADTSLASWQALREQCLNDARPDTLDTITFMDGLGRPVQVKQDSQIHDPAGQLISTRQVSGKIIYDAFGRTIASYHPTADTDASPAGATTYISSPSTIDPARSHYDVLDRVLYATAEDGSRSQMRYEFGPDQHGQTRHLTTSIDPNGVVSESFTDVRGRIRAIHQRDRVSQQDSWTHYQYNAINELTDVFDARMNRTRAEYDKLGRRVVLDNPDTGIWRYTFDPQGRLSHSHRPDGQVVTQHYAGSRLIYVDHPTPPEALGFAVQGNRQYRELDSAYTYGENGDGHNGAGRVIQIHNQSGHIRYDFGPMGEVLAEHRTISRHGPTDIHNTQALLQDTFSTYQLYDHWGRLRKLRYPDVLVPQATGAPQAQENETLTYGYDAGGLLNHIAGRDPHVPDVTGTNHSAVAYTYLSGLHYDAYRQRIRLTRHTLDGNAPLSETYRYYPQRRWLANKHTQQQGAQQLQNLHYRFDPVGNIRSVANHVPEYQSSVNNNDSTAATHALLYGTTTHHYRYDDLYRLIEAKGEHRHNPGDSNANGDQLQPDTHARYTLSQRYDNIHNITLRQRYSHNGQAEQTLDLSYQYQGAQPHAPTQVGGNAMTYDANGNRLSWQQGQSTHYAVWNSADQLQAYYHGSNVDPNHQDPNIATSAIPSERYQYGQGATRTLKQILAGTAAPIAVPNPANPTAATPSTNNNQGSETLYINPWYTVSIPAPEVQTNATDQRGLNRKRSRYINEGSKRYIVKLTGTGIQARHCQDSTQPTAHPFLWLNYHTDHLGGSNYLTDHCGVPVEHIQYFPFGETWIDNTATTHNANQQTEDYLYTGKEQDRLSGLYYYGARYYDPTNAVWLSTDPILNSYMGGKPANGVLQPKNLGLYSQSWNNPVKYLDPDGNSTIINDSGVVIDVKENDGDLGIYQLGKDGVTKTLVGYTHFPDAFVVYNDAGKRTGHAGKVHLGKNINQYMYRLMRLGESVADAVWAYESRSGGVFDVKTQHPSSDGGRKKFEGFMFAGGYVSLREAGNFLAGWIAGRKGIGFGTFQKGAGALHAREGYFQILLIYLGWGDSNHEGPAYGEINYQYTRSLLGHIMSSKDGRETASGQILYEADDGLPLLIRPEGLINRYAP